MPEQVRIGTTRLKQVTEQVDLTKVLRAHVVPLDEKGQAGQSQLVEVQDLNRRFVKFQHSLPMDFRRALIVLESAQTGRVSAEVDLSWCQFTRSGSYLSGGRFVQLFSQSA